MEAQHCSQSLVRRSGPSKRFLGFFLSFFLSLPIKQRKQCKWNTGGQDRKAATSLNTNQTYISQAEKKYLVNYNQSIVKTY